MRVVVLGASGNVGTSVLAALRDEPRVDHIVGVCRRKPDATLAKTEWVEASGRGRLVTWTVVHQAPCCRPGGGSVAVVAERGQRRE